MTDDRMALIELVEKQADGDLVREMLAFARTKGGPALRALSFHDRARMVKALALHLGGAPGQAEVAHSIQALVTRWESDESREGIAAFFDKRKAAWIAQ